jgi:branched-chain amino acid transport system permease protein
VLGGFIVGVLENLIAYFGNLLDKVTGIYVIGNGEKLPIALLMLITVLILKPSGLFGRVTVKRV